MCSLQSAHPLHSLQFLFVVKGRVLVTINSVQYTLHSHLQIHIPQGTCEHTPKWQGVYLAPILVHHHHLGALFSVRNLLSSPAELFYTMDKNVVHNEARSLAQ